MNTVSKYCGECGASLEGNARFCGECGTQVAAFQGSNASQADIVNLVPPLTPPPGTEKEALGQTAQSKELKNQETTISRVQPGQPPLKIVPLLSWSAVWGLGWLLTGISLAIFYDDPFSIPEFALPGMTAGLIAAVILQRTVGIQRVPGIGMAAVLVGTWTLLGCTVAFLIHFFHIYPYPIYFPDLVGYQYLSFNLLFPLAGFVGAFLGRIVLKQDAANTGRVISASARAKFLSGWVLCGVIPMFTGGSIVLLLITVVVISVLVFISRA